MRINDHIHHIDIKDLVLLPTYSELRSVEEVDISANFPVSGDIIRLESPYLSLQVRREFDAKESAKVGSLPLFCSDHKDRTLENRFPNDFPIGKEICINDKNAVRDLKEACDREFEVIFLSSPRGNHSILMKEFVQLAKELYPDIHIIVDKIETAEGYDDAAEWGVDTVLVDSAWSVIDMQVSKDERLAYGLRAPLIACRAHPDCALKTFAIGADLLALLSPVNIHPSELQNQLFNYGARSISDLQEKAEFILRRT